MGRDLCWPLLLSSPAVVGCPFSTPQRGGRVPRTPSGFATTRRLPRPHCCELEGAEVPSGPPVDSQVVEVAASGGLGRLPGLWPYTHSALSLPLCLLCRCLFVFVLELVPPRCIGNEIPALRSMAWGGGGSGSWRTRPASSVQLPSHWYTQQGLCRVPVACSSQLFLLLL